MCGQGGMGRKTPTVDVLWTLVFIYSLFALGCQASLFSSVLQDGRQTRRTANLLLFGLFSVVEISQELVIEHKLSTS